MRVLLLMMMVAASARAQESLPPGNGRTLVLEACVQCHDTRVLAFQHKSEAAWRRTVNEMIWRGAPLMPGEGNEVVHYLSAAKPASPPGVSARPGTQTSMAHSGSTAGTTQTGSGSRLPAGAGRRIVLNACVQCHALEITTSQRKTRDQWLHSVEQMMRLGAKLKGSEVQTVATYLYRAFGRPQ